MKYLDALERVAKQRGAKSWEHYIWRQQDAMSDICFGTEKELLDLMVDFATAIKAIE